MVNYTRRNINIVSLIISIILFFSFKFMSNNFSQVTGVLSQNLIYNTNNIFIESNTQENIPENNIEETYPLPTGDDNIQKMRV